MKKKVVICLCASANKGKTSSIRKVYEMLGGEKAIIKRENNDLLGTIIREDKIIGCSTLGDPGSDQKEWLEHLMNKHKCDVIVTASRIHKHPTIEIVKELSEKYGYSIKWLSPTYGYVKENECVLDIFHGANAEVIIKLIDKIIGGEL